MVIRLKAGLSYYEKFDDKLGMSFNGYFSMTDGFLKISTMVKRLTLSVKVVLGGKQFGDLRNVSR